MLAAVALAERVDGARSKRRATRAVRQAMTEVAEYLGNTPAVTRRSYVDPRLVDLFDAGRPSPPPRSAVADGVPPRRAPAHRARRAAPSQSLTRPSTRDAAANVRGEQTLPPVLRPRRAHRRRRRPRRRRAHRRVQPRLALAGARRGRPRHRRRAGRTVKEFAIDTFGTNDKAALLVGVPGMAADAERDDAARPARAPAPLLQQARLAGQLPQPPDAAGGDARGRLGERDGRRARPEPDRDGGPRARSSAPCSLSIVVYDRDARRLDGSVAECVKAFAGHDGALYEESYNLLNAWLAVVPGNAAHNLRRLPLLNTNCRRSELPVHAAHGRAHQPAPRRPRVPRRLRDGAPDAVLLEPALRRRRPHAGARARPAAASRSC